MEYEHVQHTGGRTVAITIGDREIEGELPRFGDRRRLHEAHRRALGWTEADDARLREVADDEEAYQAERAKGPSSEPSADDVAAVAYAAAGLCWRPALACKSLRDLRYDVVEYGEHVLDELAAQDVDVADLMVAGFELLALMAELQPDYRKIEAHRSDFGQGGTESSSTPATS